MAWHAPAPPPSLNHEDIWGPQAPQKTAPGDPRIPQEIPDSKTNILQWGTFHRTLRQMQQIHNVCGQTASTVLCDKISSWTNIALKLLWGCVPPYSATRHLGPLWWLRPYSATRPFMALPVSWNTQQTGAPDNNTFTFAYQCQWSASWNPNSHC